jgi:signal peptidase II
MQAARGTPVGHPEDGADGHEASAVTDRTLVARPRIWLLFAAVAVLAYTVDQVSKRAAVEELTGRPDVQVVGEILQLRLTYNPGAAFSLGTDFTVALSCLAIVATVVVLWFSRRIGSAVWAVGLGLILAGIDGNLTDRMLREPGPFRGEVIDFLMLPNWPIFNVADMCINVGAALILIQVFRGVQIDGTRVPVVLPGADLDATDIEPDGSDGPAEEEKGS